MAPLFQGECKTEGCHRQQSWLGGERKWSQLCKVHSVEEFGRREGPDLPPTDCWVAGWYIRGLKGTEVVPELNWGQCTTGVGGGAMVRKMARSIAVSLERHAKELDERELLRELPETGD